MATKIEWTARPGTTGETWNPTVGCTQISPGCAHCYAKTITERFHGKGSFDQLVLHEDRLTKPLHWREPRTVFVDSMSDLFHEDVPYLFILEVWLTMYLSPQHTYLVLTKRPDRMRQVVNGLQAPMPESFYEEHPSFPRTFAPELWPLPNVWLGVTVENQRWADERIPILLDTPAGVRFVSYEPALGPVAFEPHLPDRLLPNHEWRECLCADIDPADRPCIVCNARRGIDWLIVGGESGPRHRRFDPEWARSALQQCRDAGVAFFMKQMGGARPGGKLEDLPEDLRVREFPQ